MKILTKTTHTLTLVERDWNWLALLLLSVPFVVVGLIVGIAVSNVTTLSCQRSPTSGTTTAKMTCERTISGILGTDRLSIREPILRALVRKTHGTGVVLFISKTPDLELVNHRMNVGPKHEQIANTINAFIQNKQQMSLVVQQDDRLEGLLGGLMFFLPGLMLATQGLLMPIKIFCELDRQVDRAIIQKHYRLGRIQTLELPLFSIQGVAVLQSNLPTRRPCYILQLQLVDRPSIDISAPSYDRAQHQLIAAEIDRVLSSQ
jgi:hypothetical protein